MLTMFAISDTLPEAVPPATPMMNGLLKSSPVNEDPEAEDSRRSTVIFPCIK